nr:NAD(P)H:quinone oxidoreductase [Nocardiopsis mwathae]
MSARISVIYYSSTGNVHATAEAIAEGAADAGAKVRLRRVAEHAPDKAVESNPEWRDHLAATAHIETATLDDLTWADGYAFGTPTRFGNVSSQLKQFIDSAGGVWEAGELANKPVTGFTSSYELHGGQESTLLSLYNVMHHWGALIVPTGYVDYDIMHEAGGNPYGLANPSSQGAPSKALLKAARFQGGRLARIAELVAPLRAG